MNYLVTNATSCLKLFCFYIQQQVTYLRTMKPSSRVSYTPSRRPLTTRKFTPTTYFQTQEQRSRLRPKLEQGNQGMAEEKELAKALALLALPNR